MVADGQEAPGYTVTEQAALSAEATLPLAAAASMAPTDLPRQVDNSQLKYFPPIRSQGAFNSCASFSTTYYTLTFMVGRAKDWDVRSDTSHEMTVVGYNDDLWCDINANGAGVSPAPGSGRDGRAPLFLGAF